jgi:AcrR family transcriptional regulator
MRLAVAFIVCGVGHREDLLAGARRCLAERGYARTTARDLVAVSGTNLASIGYHFGSKEALLNAAMGELFAEWAERVRTLAMQAAPDTDPVTTLIASWGAIRTSFEDYRGLAAAFIEALAQAQWQPGLRAQLAATYRRCREQVAGMVTEAVADLPEAEAAAIASFQIAVCDGLLIQWLLDAEATPSAERLVAAFTALIGEGSSPRGGESVPDLGRESADGDLGAM